MPKINYIVKRSANRVRRCLWKIAMAMENNGFFGRKKKGGESERCLHNNKASAKKHEDAR